MRREGVKDCKLFFFTETERMSVLTGTPVAKHYTSILLTQVLNNVLHFHNLRPCLDSQIYGVEHISSVF